MNVYLYQNNTEKILKNIYIGEYNPFNYEYNFINKTTSQITSDGWQLLQGTPTTNSYGIRPSSTGWLTYKQSIDITNYVLSANKITISFSGYSVRNLTLHGGIALNRTSSGGDNITDLAIGYNFIELYCTSNVLQQTGLNNSGNITGECVLDLNNKTWTVSTSKGNTYNGAISDENITKIRTSTMIWCGVYSTSTNGGGLSSISIKIE